MKCATCKNCRVYAFAESFCDSEFCNKFAKEGNSDDFTEAIEEVIHCKDCKHWDGYYCHNRWYGDGYGNYAPPIKSKEGFCDLAKRKEE